MAKWGINTSVRHYYPGGVLPIVEDVSSLVRDARAGSAEARKQLIEAKISHAIALVTRLSPKYRHDVESLGELALYHLVRCVDSFLRNGHDDNIDPYITSVIPREVNRSMLEDRLISVSGTTIYRAKKRNTFDRLNALVGDIQRIEVYEELIQHLSPKVALKLLVFQESDLDLRDTIQKVILNSNDPIESKLILELRIRGCTDKEVSKAVGKSKSYVALRRVELLKLIHQELVS